MEIAQLSSLKVQATHSDFLHKSEYEVGEKKNNSIGELPIVT